MMPLPAPKPDEKEKDFMSRCMGDATMQAEHPNHDQCVAVCMNIWKDKEKKSLRGIERRYIPDALAHVCIEERKDKPAQIAGYASIFYDGTPGSEYELWPGVRERIMPGAFDAAVADAHDARCLFNHDPNLVLGRVSAGTLRLAADKRGLHYENDPPETQAGRDIQVSIKRRDITGSSFAFRVRKEEWAKDEASGADVRQVRDVELFDVSPVTYPAYQGASVAMRAEGDLVEARASHEAWKASKPPEKPPEAAKPPEAPKPEQKQSAPLQPAQPEIDEAKLRQRIADAKRWNFEHHI